MRAHVLSALALGLAIIAPACGGSADEPSAPVVVEAVEHVPDGPPSAPAVPPPPDPAAAPAAPPPAAPPPADPPETTLADVLGEVPGEDSKLVMGVFDVSAGENRLSFLVVRSDGSLVQSPTARVRVGRLGAAGGEVRAEAVDGTALVDTEAVLEPVGPHTHPAGEEVEPHDHLDTTDVYVARVTLPATGQYWIVVDPAGEDIQGYDVLDARARPLAPAVGDDAYPSDNPTLDDLPAGEITTATPPDTELLRYSIEDSLAEGVPFVAVFATPAFCTSRVCGPTIEVTEEARRELADSGDRFIHVEIYEGNDPNRGFNEWVREWRLPTEPWTFLVDGTGTIVDRFEGSISVRELVSAVREKLLGASG
jgi:hypothetical protein